MGTREISSRWYSLISLVCMLVGAAVWFGLPAGSLSALRGPVAILILLVPRFIRLRTKGLPFRRTPFDLFLLIFMLTAAAGVLTAYDHEAALAKFWPLLGGVLLFYSLVELPGQDLWSVAGLFGGLGALLGGIFLLSNQGLFISSTRQLDPDLVSGVLVVLAPLSLVFTYHQWLLLISKDRAVAASFSGWLKFFLAAGLSLIILLAIFTGADKGTWIGPVLVLSLWLWVFASKKLAHLLSDRRGKSSSGKHEPTRQRIIWAGSILVVVFVGLVLMIVSREPRLLGLLERTIGYRAVVWLGALELVRDFPFSGGGLASFGGLYSQYIQVTPYAFVSASNNLFLEVMVEQGMIGAGALIVIVLGSLFQLAYKPTQDQLAPLRMAAFSGLLLLIIQGLSENTFYESWDVWLLFLLPGLSVAISPPPGIEGKLLRNRRQQTASLVILPALVLAGVAWKWQPLLAELYSNWGTVQMARIELAGFPTGKWDKGQRLAELQPAEFWFERALHLDPRNLTAHYRLGLISMLRRDYLTAARKLEAAFAQAPNHRGIYKNLGYTYLWMGDFERAIPMLDQLPEVTHELIAYEIWWKARGREDLADLARRAVILFDN